MDEGQQQFINWALNKETISFKESATLQQTMHVMPHRQEHVQPHGLTYAAVVQRSSPQIADPTVEPTPTPEIQQQSKQQGQTTNISIPIRNRPD